jgi:hypothetical protein
MTTSTTDFLIQEILDEFFNLAIALEPENLHMDGEATKRQVTTRRRQIEQSWTKLEKSIGQRVSVDDVWAAKLGHDL